MLEREDIYTILSQTLEDYFHAVLHRNVLVRVEKSPLWNKYVIYPRLGVVISRLPSWRVAMDIYTQFNVQGNWRRKLFAWGYITLCFMTFGLLASRSLYISDKNWCKQNRYIMPCNRKIRIFDYKRGYVDAILKVGFNDYFFKNEIEYRTNPKYSFIPPLIQYGERWYREAILPGRALVRLKQPKYSEAVNRTIEEIGLMYRETLHRENIKRYCQGVISKIEKQFPVLQEKKGMSLDYVKQVIDKCVFSIKNHECIIPIVKSHGDLQTGNIMVGEDGRVTIYDWETAGDRSSWFDMGKLLLYSQRKGRYAYMINNRESKEVRSALFSLGDIEYPMSVVVPVLILEEIDFFVTEISNLPGRIGVEIMDRLTDELKQVDFLS